jgi:hypothetical protein
LGLSDPAWGKLSGFVAAGGKGDGSWPPFCAWVVLATHPTIPIQPTSATMPTVRTIRVGVIMTPSSADALGAVRASASDASWIAQSVTIFRISSKGFFGF